MMIATVPAATSTTARAVRSCWEMNIVRRRGVRTGDHRDDGAAGQGDDLRGDGATAQEPHGAGTDDKTEEGDPGCDGGQFEGVVCGHGFHR